MADPQHTLHIHLHKELAMTILSSKTRLLGTLQPTPQLCFAETQTCLPWLLKQQACDISWTCKDLALRGD